MPETPDGLTCPFCGKLVGLDLPWHLENSHLWPGALMQTGCVELPKKTWNPTTLRPVQKRLTRLEVRRLQCVYGVTFDCIGPFIRHLGQASAGHFIEHMLCPPERSSPHHAT